MTDSISNGGCCSGSVRPGTYGNAYDVAQITVDKCGRITRVTNVPISGGGGGSSQWTGTTGSPIYYVPNVGIGSSVTPTAKLQVTGNVRVSNSVTTTNVFATRYYGDGGLLSNISQSQWTGTKGDPIYYIPGVSVGSSASATANLQVSGNVYVSNAVTVPNVHVTDTLDVLGSMTANAANATFFFDTFTIPYINTQYLNVSSNTTLTGNISMYGDAYVSGSLSAARYYGDGGLLSNISSSGFTQPLPNLVVSNSVTTSNIYVANTFQVANTFFANTTTIDMNFNTLAIPYINTSNIVVSNLIASTGNINMYGNVYVSNAVTVPNAHVTDTLNVLGSMTANAANATFFFDTFTIPYINTQYLNVSSDTTLTGNLVVATANIATLNVGYLTVNSAVVYGASTLNVYGTSNLSTAVITGKQGVTTLNVTGNAYVSNAVTTTNVFAAMANISTTNTEVLSVTTNMTFTGPLATLSNLTVPGNANIEYLSVSNLSVTGNLIVTATNTQTTNSIVITNSGTATALKVTQNEPSIHTHNVAEFWDATTLAMVIDPEGNVGIHTTSSPGYALTVTDPANFETLYIRGKSDQTTLNVTGNVYVSNALTTTNVFATQYYGDAGFLSNISSSSIVQPFANLVVSNTVTTTNVIATNDVVIGPSPVELQANLHVEQGDVFIGNSAITNTNFTTTGPVNRLIFDNSANTSVVPNKIVLFSNIAGNYVCGLGVSGVNSTSASITYDGRAGHIWYTGATTNRVEQMRLTSGGAVSIGSSATNAKLYVSGFPSTNNTSVRIDSSNIALVTSGSGLVGFGTLTPSANLHVIGNIYASNALSTTNVFVSNGLGVGPGLRYALGALAFQPTHDGAGHRVHALVFAFGDLGEVDGGAGTLGSNVVIFSNVSGGSNTFVMDSNGRVSIGAGTFGGGSLLSFGRPFANKILTLYDVGAGDNPVTATNFYGFGIGTNLLRYQVADTATRHGFYGASSEYARITSTGVSILTGANPTSNLQVTGNAYISNALTTTNVFTTNVSATNVTGSTANTLTIASNVTTFQSNGAATVMTLTNGNVGIGTTSPAYALDIGQFGSSTYTLRLAAASTTSGTMGTSIRMMEANDTYGFSFQNISASRLGIFRHSASSTGSEVLTIMRDNSYVGIGTNNPVSSLHIQRAAPVGVATLPTNVICTLDAAATNNYLLFRNSADNGGPLSGIAFQDNNIGGFVAFKHYTGSASQYGDYLHLAGYNGVQIYGGTADSIDPSARTCIMQCCYNNNGSVGPVNTIAVGIGTTSPTTTLDVNGTIRTAGNQGTNALILYFLSTPFTQQVSYTNYVDTSLTFSATYIPAAARAVMADVFWSPGLVNGTTVDHQIMNLGSVSNGVQRTWTDAGWGSNPSSWLGTMNNQIVRLLSDGENGGGTAYFIGLRGIWFASKTIPIAANGVMYYSNYGNSGSSGYLYFVVKGYYM